MLIGDRGITRNAYCHSIRQMKLPTWKEAKENIDLDAATPLDTFIQNWEPLVNEDAKEWREQLINVLKYMGAQLRDNPQAYTITPEFDDSQLTLSIDPDVE